jgi:hypothetical protein
LRLAAAAFAALLLAGCAGKAPVPDARRLELSVDPAPPTGLPSGTIVKVAARAVPDAELAWVSGTVKIFGAPVLALKPDADGKTWRFKTMVPPMVTVPPGKYEVKAWGRTKNGEELQGLLNYEVK